MYFLLFADKKDKGTWSLLTAILYFVFLLHKTKLRSHKELIHSEFDLKTHSSQQKPPMLFSRL